MSSVLSSRSPYLVFLISVTIFLVIPDVSYASAAKFVNCDGCSSFQREAAAASATQSGRVYVMDATGDTINAFEVYYYPIFNPPQSVAVSVSTPTRIADYFDDAIDKLHTAEAPGAPIPASVVGSAHELVGNNQKQVALSEYLLGVFFKEPLFGGEPDEELEDLRDELIEGKPLKVVFPDLSTAIMRLIDYAVGDAEFKLSDDSLVGPQNNLIPDSAGDVVTGLSGSFSAGGIGGLGARDNMVNTWGLLGIIVSGGGASGDGGTCVTYSCESTSSGMTCTLTFHMSGC